MRRVVTILVMAGACFAQRYSFRQYALAEGLQNLAVLSLAQDSKGFLWAGSEGGLYRYDGTRFHLMGAAEGLPCTGEVQGLHVSLDGALWANTCSQLFRFDGERFQSAAGIGEMLNRAEALADAPNGNLVVATSSGLQEVTPGKDGFLTARRYLPGSGPASQPARGLFRYGVQLWFGCGNKLCVEENGNVLVYGEAEGLPADSWDAIAATPDGIVWARSPSKLYRKSPGAGRFRRESFEIAHSMYWGALTVAPDGSLMVPTDKGVAINQGGQWSLIDESRGLSVSMTTAVLCDREGLLWIALTGSGVVRALGRGEWESWTKAQGLPSNLVWNIRRDRKGALWVATSLGVTRLPGKLPARTWRSKDGLGGENVRWLGETQDGAIWAIARPGGLSRIDPVAGTVRTLGLEDGLGQALHRGLVDHLGRLWVAAADGLFRNDAPCSSTRFAKVNPPGLLGKGAWSVSEDKRGAVWVIGPDGLWRFQQDQWHRYQKSDGLLSDNPYIAVAGADNSLWLRHRFDAGVERLEFDGDRIARATAIVPSAGTAVDVTAFHGFDSAGHFWRGTAKGVAVLHDGAWTQYSTEDGLIWDDCDGEAFWADPDDSVWIGTSGGLSHFRPPPGKPSEPAADPIITSLEIHKNPRLVRVSFSSLNYRYDQLVRLGYRFDDGLWIETPERSVSIAGLGPGRHRIEIRSRIRNGPLSPKLAIADFDIEPLWNESWWFRCLVVLLVLSLTAGGVRWRHRALRLRNAILEGAVQQRTLELAAERAKVLEEKRRADVANAAKGQFLANMSHEIRTPLNGLLGLTQLLEDLHDSTERREAIQLIRSSGQMLLGVINDILDFSKVEAGKLELEIAPFELRLNLEEAVGLFRAAAAEKGVRLHLTLETDLPHWVAGDYIRLRQVVQNLISNALKFTQSGEVVLTAAVVAQEATSPDETGHSIRIEVSDTGIGIPPDKIGKLFSSFSQADSSIGRRYGGTGLGLAICERLVQLMGGTISVQSKPGQGSTFRFTVRLGRATAPALVLPKIAACSEAAKLKVLLAEDNKVNQMVGLRLLRKLGVCADLAENGEEVVAAAERNSYDLILMDVQMPGMDGIAATHAIRENFSGKLQPFICGLSAHATTDFQEMCLDSGMDAYLTKPLDIQKLEVLITQRCAESAV